MHTDMHGCWCDLELPSEVFAHACGDTCGLQANVRADKLFTSEYSTGCMLDVLQGLRPQDSGGFFAYDGSRIEF